MASPSFQTVATELLEHAEAAHAYFRALGYRVYIEPMEATYPSRPTLLCKRGATQLVVQVCGRIDMRDVRDWVALAKAEARDFRIAIWTTAETQKRSLPRCQVELVTSGVGIFVSGVKVVTLKEPVDQNSPAGLPDLASRRAPVRRLLGKAYEHFEAQRWKDGFDEACRTLEQSALAHVVKALKSGRLAIYSAAGVKRTIKIADIEKQTLGALAKTLADAQPLNALDVQVQKALQQINADRIRLTHKNRKASTEKVLRQNVMRHMHVILRAMEALTA